MDTMHLFAGAGGGLLADKILGHTPLVAVEWEPYPAQVLRERRDEGWFPGLRVWEGDVRMFDPSEYTGRVDCIHAGFPCQDISQAGKQAGVGEGTRSGLYREVLRIAGIVRPRFIFLENVAAIKSNGLETVLKDLACMGYDTRWMCIRASDVGAPHHRDRWFALCHANTSSSDGGSESAKQQSWSKELVGDSARQVGTFLAHSNGERSQGTEGGSCTKEKGKSCRYTFEFCKNVAHTQCQRLQGQREYVDAEHSTQSRNWKTTESINGSTPDFWEIEPRVGRVVDGMAHRSHRLKAIGNGQVPLQVAVAFTILAKGLI